MFKTKEKKVREKGIIRVGKYTKKERERQKLPTATHQDYAIV